MGTEPLVRRLVVFFLVISLPVSLLAFASGKAGALSCAVPASPEEEYTRYKEYADVVVVGTVVQDGGFPELSQVKVNVERVFKGNAGEKIGVEEGSGNFALNFEEGDRYLFYLREQDNDLTVPLCGGTQPLSGELPPEVAASLGEGIAPGTTSQPLPETGGHMLPVAVTLALVGLIAVGGSSLALWRRTG